MGYLANFFVSIDQLGNVLAGGDPDNTISSRVGFYNHATREHPNTHLAWRLFEQIIDATFYPIDGDGHCKEAFYNDAGEVFDTGTKNWAVVVLAFFIILSCIPIAILLYILWLIGVVHPKEIKRSEKIKDRLTIVQAKLNGTLNELGYDPTKLDPVLSQYARGSVLMAQDVEKVINDLIIRQKSRS